MAAAAFDNLASRYDKSWTCSPVGMAQRMCVWRLLDGVLQSGDNILDLGCGTGSDAVHLMSRGVHVYAIDASPNMVSIARSKDVNAHRLSIEHLQAVSGCFDGALSNFGALNCLPTLEPTAQELARLIRPGGRLILCVLGAFCCWETLHFLRRAQFRKAFRRLSRRPSHTSIGMDVTYHRVRDLKAVFAKDFRLIRCLGVGVSMPPSYITELPVGIIRALTTFDRMVEHWPVFRGIADHRLLLFERV